MNTKWKKTGINIVHSTATNEERRRSFNGLNAQATDDKIATFAQIIGKLCGEAVAEVNVTRATILTVSSQA